MPMWSPAKSSYSRGAAGSGATGANLNSSKFIVRGRSRSLGPAAAEMVNARARAIIRFLPIHEENRNSMIRESSATPQLIRQKQIELLSCRDGVHFSWNYLG